MSRPAQASEGHCLPQIRFLALRAAALAAIAVVSACGAGGFSLDKADVDRSLLTGSVPATPSAYADPGQRSDEITIGNAVSSADIEELRGQAIPWANAETGARGAISALNENTHRGVLCRQFSATRESFDGVGMFKGEICSAGAGTWQMTSFDPV